MQNESHDGRANTASPATPVFELSIQVPANLKAPLVLFLESQGITDFVEGFVDCYLDFDYENPEKDLYSEKGASEPVVIYRESNAEAQNLLRSLQIALAQPQTAELFGLTNSAVTFSLKAVAAQDWQESWKASFVPISIANGALWVLPPWEKDKILDPQSRRLVIDPGMAFGTGQHATTQVCLELLWFLIHKMNFKVTEFLDVGTGSGVLAIAAVLWGARGGLGIDIDPACAEIALKNAQLNAVDGVQFSSDSLDVISKNAAQPCYDVVLANIQIGPISKLFDGMWHCLKANGFLIVSGVLFEESEQLSSLLNTKASFKHRVIKKLTLNDWMGWLICKEG